jgi:DNA-binding transcriptional ArsR family regulator
MSFTSEEPPAHPLGELPGKSIRLTDPETMRALAHPARIAIWQHLLLEGPATATECAPAAGLSPSACSYHLRQLGRYGFVEQDQAAAANGRERPWRAVVTSTTMDDLNDPAAVTAARLLDYSLAEHWAQTRQRYVAREEEYPPEWRRAAGGDQTVLYVTPDELAGLRDGIRKLYLPLIRLSGQKRPAGARPVQGVIEFAPTFGPDDPGDDGSAAAERPGG